jgi:hypothetical protein
VKLLYSRTIFIKRVQTVGKKCENLHGKKSAAMLIFPASLPGSARWIELIVEEFW